MEQQGELQDQIQQILIKLKVSEERQQMCENQLANLSNAQEPLRDERAEENEDIVPDLSSGDQIQLEPFKAIPEFSGLGGTYRPWRNQVARRMKIIDRFKKHPKYEAALSIVRSKITGAASNVLTNNKTAYNIIAILRTLDSSFADHRPLYVVETEMTSIRQLGKNLQEYHDAINQALHLVITKIVHAYKQEAEQRSLVAEAQRKAVRTFIIGLNNSMMRNILYGRTPGTLAEAFAIAQTVYHDYQHTESQRQQKPNLPKPNTNYNNKKPNLNQSENNNKYANKPEAGKKIEWRKPNQQQTQRVNQIRDDESDPNQGYEGDLHEEIPEDLISNASIESNQSNTASTFLSE